MSCKETVLRDSNEISIEFDVRLSTLNVQQCNNTGLICIVPFSLIKLFN